MHGWVGAGEGRWPLFVPGVTSLVVLVLCALSGCSDPSSRDSSRGTPPLPSGGPVEGVAHGSFPTPAGLVAEWVAMWNTYDLDRVGTLFLQDSSLTYFSSEFQGVIRGFDAVLEHHRGFGFVPGGEDRGTRLWVEELTEDVFGEAAVLTGIWFFSRGGEGDEGAGQGLNPSEEGVDRADGQPPQRGPVTFVCVRAGDVWRFVHMNFGNYLQPDESFSE